MGMNNEQRTEGKPAREKWIPRRKRIIMMIGIIIIIMVIGASSSYLIWTWYNDTLLKKTAIATGNNGDINLYVKFNRTVKLNESTVVNFTLENSGNVEYRFCPLYVGGEFIITNRNGDEIYYSHACIDYEVTNDSLVELHPGEKTYWERSYLPYSAGMNIGEDYFMTCYYSSLVMLIDPYIVEYWDGDIVTNTVLIRVV